MRIQFEDDHILVIEKPEKLLTIASEKVKDRTAYVFLTEYVKKGAPRSENRVWIVHRLDRDTSGLMVFAKTEKAKRILQENWDKSEKKYFAVVEGTPPESSGTFQAYLNEDDPGKVYIAREENTGRLAITHYKLLKKNDKYSLLEMTLETGRRHQIRVHLAACNLPIVGDDVYGRYERGVELGLRAVGLVFENPYTRRRVDIRAPREEFLKEYGFSPKAAPAK